jgi:ribosomal protein S8
MDKPSYFAILTADVRYDKTLKPLARLLYAEITALCNKEGYCWSSNQYFADLYEVDPKTVSGWIGQLKTKGYITVQLEYKEGTKQVLKRYIRINEGGMDKIMDTLPIKKCIPSPQNDGDPPHKIMEDNKTINNTFNNTTNKGTRFTPPSVDEVNDYCNQRNNLVDPQTFIDFYQAKGWMVGKNKMKDWKACVRTWETNRKQRSKPKQQGTIKDRSIEDALTDTSWANLL